MMRMMAVDDWPRASPYVAADRRWGDVGLTGAARHGRLGPGVGEQAAITAGAAWRIVDADEAGVMAVMGPAGVVIAAWCTGSRRCRRGHEAEAGCGKCRKATQCEDTHAVSLPHRP